MEVRKRSLPESTCPEYKRTFQWLLFFRNKALPDSKRFSNKVLWAHGVVVIMFDFHRSDRGSNRGRGDEFS